MESLRDKTWVVIIEIVVAITAISGWGIRDVVSLWDKWRDQKIEELRNEAITLFINTPNDTIALERPISLFHEVYKQRPKDQTGYELLVNRAEAIIRAENFQYDRIAEKLLEEALTLSKFPQKAKNRLKDIRGIKP